MEENTTNKEVIDISADLHEGSQNSCRDIPMHHHRIPIKELSLPTNGSVITNPQHLTYYAHYYPEYYSQLIRYTTATPAPITTNVEKISIHDPAPIIGSKVGAERAFRQMSHYFDYESYVQQVNNETLVNGKIRRPKFTKREIEKLKQRKKAIKHKKMLEWLNND